MIPDSELDELLLSFCDPYCRKVAQIAGNTLNAIEVRGISLDGTSAGQIDTRLAALIGAGRLEAKGDIKRWRYREVRLPGGRGEAAQ